MIKGVIGYKVLSYKDLEPILIQLRSHAIQYSGFASAENLVSEEDYSVVVMMSIGRTIKNWRIWVESKITANLPRQAKAVVLGAARMTAFRAIPTVA